MSKGKDQIYKQAVVAITNVLYDIKADRPPRSEQFIDLLGEDQQRDNKRKISQLVQHNKDWIANAIREAANSAFVELQEEEIDQMVYFLTTAEESFSLPKEQQLPQVFDRRKKDPVLSLTWNMKWEKLGDVLFLKLLTEGLLLNDTHAKGRSWWESGTDPDVNGRPFILTVAKIEGYKEPLVVCMPNIKKANNKNPEIIQDINKDTGGTHGEILAFKAITSFLHLCVLDWKKLKINLYIRALGMTHNTTCKGCDEDFKAFEREQEGGELHWHVQQEIQGIKTTLRLPSN